MKVSWKSKKNLKPEILLKKLDELIKVGEDGSISFSAFEYQNNMAALYSMINFPEQSISMKNIILLKNSVSNAAKLGKIDKDNVLNELIKLNKEETSKQELEYNILTSISMDYQLPAEGLNIGKSNIKFFSDTYPLEFISRSETLKSINSKMEFEQKEYTKIIIKTKAKSEIEAINQSLDDLDLLRAIFSLFTNSIMMWRFTDMNSPINKIRLGQVHTIHDSSGKNINSTRYWYEPNYIENDIFTLQDPKKEVFEENVKFVIVQLEKCNYSQKIKNALLRYVRAFDEKNYNIALLEIWGSLESIIVPNESNKDNLSKRCSFLYKDGEYHKQILEHLREYRNQSVHDGIKNEEVKHYCYQVQSYFLQLILFHLHRVDDFKTLDEANNFLDQSTSIEKLEKEKKLLERVIKFRNGE